MPDHNGDRDSHCSFRRSVPKYLGHGSPYVPDSRHLIASFGSVHFSLIPSAPAVHGATRRSNTRQLHLKQNGIGDTMVWEGWGHGMSLGLCGPGNKHLGLVGVF